MRVAGPLALRARCFGNTWLQVRLLIFESDFLSPIPDCLPVCNREFLYQIDLIVLLSRIAPARNACRARQVSVSLLLRPDDCMGFGKSNLDFRGFIENSGNRGRKFLSPVLAGGAISSVFAVKAPA